MCGARRFRTKMPLATWCCIWQANVRQWIVCLEWAARKDHRDRDSEFECAVR